MGRAGIWERGPARGGCDIVIADGDEKRNAAGGEEKRIQGGAKWQEKEREREEDCGIFEQRRFTMMVASPVKANVALPSLLLRRNVQPPV